MKINRHVQTNLSYSIRYLQVMTPSCILLTVVLSVLPVLPLQCILYILFFSLPWKFTLLDIFRLQSYTKLRCCKLIILILISVWFRNFSYSPEEIPRNARVYTFRQMAHQSVQIIYTYSFKLQSYKKCLELETANKSPISSFVVYVCFICLFFIRFHHLLTEVYTTMRLH